MTTATATLETLYTLASEGVCLNCYHPHHIQACPEIRAALMPRVATYRAADWAEAHRIATTITEDRVTFGIGNNYPEPYAIFYLDALTGEGTGYCVYRCEDGQLAGLVAYIRLV